MIYIVIPVFNRWHFTKPCLESLLQQTYTDFKIIVVDHGSTDGTSEFIEKEYPSVVLLKGDESMWWSAATNLGVNKALELSQSVSDFVLTLNNDLTVKPDYLEHLLTVSHENKKSVIGSVLVNSKDPKQVVFAGVSWNKWNAKYRSIIDLSQFHTIQKEHRSFNSDLLPGRGTLIPITAFKIVGLYDTENFPHYAGDEEFSNRCKKAGYSIIISTRALVYGEIDATGLKNIHVKRTFAYWKDLFTSQRSPVNLKVRWKWAKTHTPLPPIYFIIDFSRIILSQLKKRS